MGTSSLVLLFSFQNCSQTKFSESPSEATSAKSEVVADECIKNPELESCAPICSFNGISYKSGEAITAFQTSSVASGRSCVSEQRICNSGSFSGSFNFASCIVSQPASCLFNGQTIAHGQSVNAFLNSTVSFGSACSSELRTCNKLFF